MFGINVAYCSRYWSFNICRFTGDGIKISGRETGSRINRAMTVKEARRLVEMQPAPDLNYIALYPRVYITK